MQIVRARSLLGTVLLATWLQPGTAAGQTSAGSDRSCADIAKTARYRVDQTSVVSASYTSRRLVEGPVLLDEKSLEDIRSRARKRYREHVDVPSARFDLTALTLECIADDNAGTVDIEARIDRLLVLRGDTLGLLLDDSFLIRPNVLPDPLRMFLRFDHDQTARNVVGFHLGLHDAGDSTFIANVGINGWKSFGEEFYRFAVDTVSSDWYDADRNWHSGTQLHFWFEDVPFGRATLNLKGFSEGVSLERQMGRVNARGNMGFRFAHGGLDVPGFPDQRLNEVAFESSWHQELTTHGGFAQLNGWFDAARAFGIGSNFMRYASTGRVWEDVLATTVDLTMSVAGSAGAPNHRLFRGGARVDPFLGSRVTTPEEFSLPGPVVRGFGVGGVGLAAAIPTGSAIDDMGATAFHGASLTISLPGVSHALLKTRNRAMRDEVQAQMTEQFVGTVVDNMSELMDKGRSADKAIEIASREAGELRRTLQNVINHGRSFSARPILIGDWAHLKSETIGEAWSYGLGFRFAAPSWGGELLLLRNGWTSAIASSAPDRVVELRIRLGKITR